VGIYTADKKFIHAAGKRRGLTESKITDPYYLNRIIGARRLY
jgi:cell wall-associated NlpC family hydrolase